jgi:hypothetical protein
MRPWGTARDHQATRANASVFNALLSREEQPGPDHNFNTFNRALAAESDNPRDGASLAPTWRTPPSCAIPHTSYLAPSPRHRAGIRERCGDDAVSQPWLTDHRPLVQRAAMVSTASLAGPRPRDGRRARAVQRDGLPAARLGVLVHRRCPDQDVFATNVLLQEFMRVTGPGRDQDFDSNGPIR